MRLVTCFGQLVSIFLLFSLSLTVTGMQSPAVERARVGLRGVIPGTTTTDELRNNDRWGTPINSTSPGKGITRLQYRFSVWKEVNVFIEDKTVRMIEVVPPERVPAELLAEKLNLGNLIPSQGGDDSGETPGATAVAPDWSLLSCSGAANVVLYVEKVEDKQYVKLMRFLAKRTSIREGVRTRAVLDQRQLVELYGVTPGVTTEEEVLKNPQWGEPENRVTQKDGMVLLEYKIGEWKKVTAVIQNRKVRSIDAFPQQNLSPKSLAEKFALGDLIARNDLPDLAVAGTPVSESWEILECANNQVVLFSSKDAGDPNVTLMRLFSDPSQGVLFGSGEESSLIAKTVAEMLPRYHHSKKPLNDEIARGWLDNLLQKLDPYKIFFLQSDVDRFLQKQNDLDDLARAGDIQTAYDVFLTYRRSFEKQLPLIKKLIAQEHDFTRDESIPRDPAAIPWSRTEDEIDEVLRKRIKYFLLRHKSNGVDLDKARDLVAQSFENSHRWARQMNDESLMEWYLSILAETYGDGQRYLSPQTLENALINVRRRLVGIGASLKYEDGFTIVQELILGGPAERDGRIQPGDKIVGVGQGETGDIEVVVGMKLSEVVEKIRGENESIVRLRILRENDPDPRVYFLKRGPVQLSGVRSRIVERFDENAGKRINIGYIYVPGFYGQLTSSGANGQQAGSCTSDVRKILEDPGNGFKAAGVQAVVVDLRLVGAGTLKDSINTAGLFVGPKPIVRRKDAEGKQTNIIPNHKDHVWDGPLVVLIRRASSMTAMMFAGAVQDHDRGLIVGDSKIESRAPVHRFFNVAQHLSPMNGSRNLGTLQIISDVYSFPKGGSIESGLEPDVFLPWLLRDQVQAAPGPKNEFDSLSRRRRESSAHFRKLEESIRLKLSYQAPENFSLNEEDYLKALAEVPSTEEGNEKILHLQKGENFDGDDFMEEVFAITLDYMRLHKGKPGSEARVGDTIEINIETSSVQVGEDVIGSVSKGKRFEVLKISGSWLQIEPVLNGQRRLGWVNRKDVVVVEDKD